MPHDSIELDFWRELTEIEAESIGWVPLESGAYLHIASPEDAVITVVGIPDASMAEMNVLLVV